ncbi:MAG: penicillin acylase family protein, partial [Anaerolineae bacterium]|nr:penicillin acylase family protein [Anaerolineae bacterium]
MKTVRKILIILAACALVVAVVLIALTYYTVRRPLPKQEGELRVEGMQDAITIYRDSWGVAHIYAATPYDLFFAQGFAHAQDRWWQMDLNRRFALGTLSELFGEDETIQAADAIARTLGWGRIAQANWEAALPESRAALAAYAAGVNAYIADRSPGELALEYTLLDLRGGAIVIPPWTPLDSLAWSAAMHWQTSGSAIREIENAQALTRVDGAMLGLYAPLNAPESSPTILSAEDLGLPADVTPAPEPEITLPTGVDYTRLPLDRALAALDLIGPRGVPESTGWVVSGARSATGLPLLAVAPGAPVEMPSPWYEVGLYCIETSYACPYNVTGFSMPGLPAVFSGHNDRIAWGLTGAWIDEQDLTIIRLNPDNPAQYAWDGGWRDLEITEEALIVNGLEEPVPITIARTHLGPVIALPPPLVGRDQALVVHWTGQYVPYDPVASLLRLNRARNWDEFHRALSLWGGAASNALYADVDGHIGYQLIGRVPVRSAQHSGLLPVSSQEDGAGWFGFLPYDLLPSALDPAEGLIVAANNRIAPPGYTESLAETLSGTFGPEAALQLAVTWDPGYRADRIARRLRDVDAHTPESFADIQGDVTSDFAAEIMPYLLNLPLEEGTLSEMRDWLGEWDRRYALDSPQAALFGAFWLRLLEFTYADELGTPPCDCALMRQPMIALLATANHAWWDDVQTRFVVERRDAILRKAFEQAVIDLTNTLGSTRDEWRWGDLHTVTFIGRL